MKIPEVKVNNLSFNKFEVLKGNSRFLILINPLLNFEKLTKGKYINYLTTCAKNYNRVYLVTESKLSLTQKDIINVLGIEIGSKIELTYPENLDKIINDLIY